MSTVCPSTIGDVGLSELRVDGDNTVGLESMCVGGGQGMAMIVERRS